MITSLLLYFDGADNSTTFVDETGKVVTPFGNAKISTAQSNFGGSSGYFDGTGDYLSIPDSLDFVFGTGDFTIECWIKTSIGNKTIVDRYSANPATWQLFINSSGYLQWYTSTIFKTGSVSVIDNSWYHVAVVKYNNLLHFYIGGVENGSGTTDNNNYSVQLTYLGIGAQINNRNGGFDYNGYIDDLRITKGLARYTANFTPPNKSFYPSVTVGNNVTIAGVGAGHAVAILDAATKALVRTATPAVDGSWSATVPAGNYYVLYFGAGCQPVAHGPYTVS